MAGRGRTWGEWAGSWGEWAGGAWEGMKKVVFKPLEPIWNAMVWAVDTVTKFFWDVVDYCIGMVWDFGYYIYDFFLGEKGVIWYGVDAAWDWFLKLFPDLNLITENYSETFFFTMQLVGRLNNFFPLVEASTLFGIFLIFIFFFLASKAILKLIPTIG
jgi:hypothetical protein